MATIVNVYLTDRLANKRQIALLSDLIAPGRNQAPRLLFPFGALAWLITHAFALLEAVVAWFVQRVIGWLIQRFVRPRQGQKHALTGR